MTREEELDWLCRLRSKMPIYMPKDIVNNEMYEELDTVIKAIEQDPLEVEAAKLQKAYNKGFEDCRQAVCKIIDDIRDCVSVEGYWAFLERLKKLPPVNPQPKTGHWIKSKDGYMRCDKCGSRGSAIKARFCHHCGARMESKE